MPDPSATEANPKQLKWRRQSFRPGERVAVAVSGGADSVALLLAMAAARGSSGLVLSAVHVHHGLRGEEADGDEQFVRELAERLAVPLRAERGDVPALAAAHGQGTEEAARALRRGVFERMLAAREVDAVVTAHSLDDQAETVLMKLIRGAWTEGLAGIAPVVELPGGRIVRPMLEVTRAEVIAYLEAAGQPWREDSSNAELLYTRNRIRHTLLPALAEFNPQIRTQLARMAAVARDEEAWWQGELARTLPTLVLPGEPARGGGRSTSTRPEQASIGVEVERLRNLHRAVQRRVLRAAGRQLGANLSADAVEMLLAMAGTGEAGGRSPAQRLERSGAVVLPGGVLAQRTPRELRLSLGNAPVKRVVKGVSEQPGSGPVYPLAVPGSVQAEAYGVMVTAEAVSANGNGRPLEVREWRAGDRITLRHSRGMKKVAEVLDRLKILGAEREGWPVVARGGRVLWMRGAEVDAAVEAEEQVRLAVRPLSTTG
jgi:tRNA(Ile)-lysidine synthase